MDEIAEHNRRAWNRQAKERLRWSTPASEEEIANARAGSPRIILVGVRPLGLPESRRLESWLSHDLGPEGPRKGLKAKLQPLQLIPRAARHKTRHSNAPSSQSRSIRSASPG